jgi:hypothetical protein
MCGQLVAAQCTLPCLPQRSSRIFARRLKKEKEEEKRKAKKKKQKK